jgi:hypothetical protein
VRRRRLLGALRSQLPAPPAPSAAPAAAPGPPQFPWNFFETTREATADIRISGDVDHAGARGVPCFIPERTTCTQHTHFWLQLHESQKQVSTCICLIIASSDLLRSTAQCLAYHGASADDHTWEQHA